MSWLSGFSLGDIIEKLAKFYTLEPVMGQLQGIVKNDFRESVTEVTPSNYAGIGVNSFGSPISDFENPRSHMALEAEVENQRGKAHGSRSFNQFN